MSKEEVPGYSLKEGIIRSLKRGLKIGIATFAVTALATFSSILPSEYLFAAPILTAILTFLEKMERNWRENK